MFSFGTELFNDLRIFNLNRTVLNWLNYTEDMLLLSMSNISSYKIKKTIIKICFYIWLNISTWLNGVWTLCVNSTYFGVANID